jgi:P2 family phage contractile tail tube protein
MILKVLKNFALFVDGRGYAGRCDEVTPPKLTLKTEEHRAGGMDAPIELDMGMEKLELQGTLAEYSAEVIKLFGLTTDAVKQLTLRGAIEGDDGVVPVVINLRGAWKELDPGTWKTAGKMPLKFSVGCRYYKMTIDNDELIEIDIENMVRKIGGTDQLAAQRDALGI